MPLPDTIRVKLSSEAAEYVSITPVVVQEMPVRDLVDRYRVKTATAATRRRAIRIKAGEPPGG